MRLIPVNSSLFFFAYAINKNMEREPDYENVIFLDEYPEIIERRRVKLALGGLKRMVNADPASVLEFPQTPSGEAATELPDQPA